MNETEKAVFAAAYGAAYATLMLHPRSTRWSHEAAERAARIGWEAVTRMHSAVSKLPSAAQVILGFKDEYQG